MTRSTHLLSLLLAAAGLAACQSAPVARSSAPETPPTTADAVGELRKGSGYLRGYLAREQLPDSLALLAPPPAAGSAQETADLDTHRQTRALRGSPRWQVATQDVNLKFPQAANVFSCALDLPISEQQTPHLTMLLRRTLADAGLATYKAKDHYNRKRPFVTQNESTCAPQEEASLAKDGSYPSGHAALGWAWGLVLASLDPARADALIQRGHAFGQSRVVCGVHWQSDVDAGRLVGAAAVARLQADPVFQAQAALAKSELASMRAQGQRSPRPDCAQETQALAR